MDAVEAALVGHPLLRPQRGDQLEQLVHAGAALAVRDADGLELGLHPAHPDAEDRPATGQLVERRPLLRELHRLAERQHQDERAELDRAGDPRQRRQQRDRLEPGRPVGRRGDEQVVDEHRGLEAEVLGTTQVGAHLGERRRLVAKREARQPKAEVHAATHLASARRRRCPGP